MKYILFDAGPPLGKFDLFESGLDRVALVILCVVVPIITIFAIVMILKITKKKKEDNKE